MGIVTSHSVEERRRKEQTRLDSLKTASERNKWGQFATPPVLALSLARYAHTLMGETPVRFLDPAIGTGSFFSAASQAFGQKHITAAAGIELDPFFAETAASLWKGRGLHVIKGDFTKQVPPAQLFNLVVAQKRGCLHMVGLGHLVFRVGDALGKTRIVGQQEEPAGVQVEAAHG